MPRTGLLHTGGIPGAESVKRSQWASRNGVMRSGLSGAKPVGRPIRRHGGTAGVRAPADPVVWELRVQDPLGGRMRPLKI